MEGLEYVQSRAARLVRGMELQMFILEKRRLRGDKAVSGHRLDLMISKDFSILDDSVML